MNSADFLVRLIVARSIDRVIAEHVVEELPDDTQRALRNMILTIHLLGLYR